MLWRPRKTETPKVKPREAGAVGSTIRRRGRRKRERGQTGERGVYAVVLGGGRACESNSPRVTFAVFLYVGGCVKGRKRCEHWRAFPRGSRRTTPQGDSRLQEPERGPWASAGARSPAGREGAVWWDLPGRRSGCVEDGLSGRTQGTGVTDPSLGLVTAHRAGLLTGLVPSRSLLCQRTEPVAHPRPGESCPLEGPRFCFRPTHRHTVPTMPARRPALSPSSGDPFHHMTAPPAICEQLLGVGG